MTNRTKPRLAGEHQLHRSVVELLFVYSCFGLLAFAHVPNGELRAKATACKLKGMGTRPGVPDLLVWAANGVHFGLELKSARRGLSPDQVVWHSTLARLGHRTYVCRSVDDVEAALRDNGVPAAVRLQDAPKSISGVPERKTPGGHSSPLKSPSGGIIP